MSKEIWKVWKDCRRYRKDGVCFQGSLWEISDQGRVKRNEELYECKLSAGYKVISGSITLHRTVAMLFIPNPENKPCIDHINGNKLDNRACNLRWVTYKENNNNPITKRRQIKSLKKYYNNHPNVHKGENNPMYGKNAEDYMTEEAIKLKRERTSTSLKKFWSNKSESYKQDFGEKMRNIWKDKYNNGYVSPMKGHIFSEERNKKISDSCQGEKNPMYGVPPKNKGKHKVWDNKELNKYHYE